MHLGTPVDGRAAVVLAVPEHAGERSHAESRHVGAREQLGVDGHDDRLAARCLEAIGAGDARALEQRIDRHAVELLAWFAEPELREARKLLRLRHGGVDRDAARRGAVLAARPAAPEIARALEGEPVDVAVAPVHDAESGESEIVGKLRGKRRVAVNEIAFLVQNRTRLAVCDGVDGDRLAVELVDVEEAHRQRVVLEQRAVRPEFDLLNGVEVDRLHHRRRPRRRGVGLRCPRAREIAQAFVAERLRRPVAQAAAGAQRATTGRERNEPGPKLQESSAIDGNS